MRKGLEDDYCSAGRNVFRNPGTKRPVSGCPYMEKHRRREKSISLDAAIRLTLRIRDWSISGATGHFDLIRDRQSTLRP